MNVLELLEEIEDIVNTAPSVPLTGKIMVDGDALTEIVDAIRKSLPDDVHQAKWIKEQKDRILGEGKSEYEKIITEAKKQAEYLVETDDITLKAQKRADVLAENTERYTTELKMRTYDYVDNMLYNMQQRMDFLNAKYVDEMYSNLEKSFEEIGNVLQENRDEIKNMAYRTKNGEDEVLMSDEEITEE